MLHPSYYDKILSCNLGHEMQEGHGFSSLDSGQFFCRKKKSYPREIVVNRTRAEWNGTWSVYIQSHL